MIPSIANRRSIREFKNTPVSRREIEEILRAGSLAPSSKNRQPWRFVVVSGAAKAAFLAAMREGMLREKEEPLLPESACYRGGAEYTLKIMEQAPTVILVVNPLGISLRRAVNAEERVYEICNAQSIGACVENMALAAAELGLGSLWICDTYFAYGALSEWLDGDGELVAALAVGYADEAPAARPRKALEGIVEWRTEN